MGIPLHFTNEPGPPHTQYANLPVQYTQHYKGVTCAGAFFSVRGRFYRLNVATPSFL